MSARAPTPALRNLLAGIAASACALSWGCYFQVGDSFDQIYGVGFGELPEPEVQARMRRFVDAVQPAAARAGGEVVGAPVLLAERGVGEGGEPHVRALVLFRFESERAYEAFAASPEVESAMELLGPRGVVRRAQARPVEPPP